MNSNKSNQRYRLYREHKYVVFMLYKLDMQVARANFNKVIECENIEKELETVISLLEGHALHEDSVIHNLLRAKEIPAYEKIERQHLAHQDVFAKLRDIILAIKTSGSNEEKIALGHKFYLQLRVFISDLLYHLYQEETELMNELQHHYSDQQLREIDSSVYKAMTAEQIKQMCQTLFPCMNTDDYKHFIYDLKKAVPEKFEKISTDIMNLCTEIEIDIEKCL